MASERMSEADYMALLMSLQKEMTEMKGMNEEVTRKNEDETSTMPSSSKGERRDEKEARGGGTVCWTDQFCQQVLRHPN